MALPWSKELMVVAEESRKIAESLGHVPTSAHLLLTLFTIRNRAKELLRENSITGDAVIDKLEQTPFEKPDILDRVFKRAQDVAAVSNAQQVTCLHVLVALCSFIDSAAYQLMSKVGINMAALRTTTLSLLAGETYDAAEPIHDVDHVAALARVARAGVEPQRQSTRVSATVAVEAPTTQDAEPRVPQDPRRGVPSKPPEDAPTASPRLREPDDVRRERLRRQEEQRPAPPKDTQRSLATRLFGTAPIAQPPRPVTGASVAGRPLTVHAPTAPPPAARPATGAAARHHYLLRDNQFPLLAKFGRNLTLLAIDGQLDRVIGRDREIEQIVDILNKRRSNAPVLVGDPGVGKTAVVEGLACRMVGVDGDVPPGLEGRILVEVEATKLLAGTGLRGSFAERLHQLKTEVARAEGRVVLFLDELHHWIGMGSGGDGAADGAGELKTALARGEFPCIGATTFDEFRRFIENDPAFARRFQQVRVEEPSPDDAIRVLRGVRAEYERHHGVSFDPDAIDAAVRLTHRYLPAQKLPDKAIGALDLAGSRARRTGASVVGKNLVMTVVGELAGISPDKLLMADRERFLNLEEQLMQRVVGHTHVIERVSQVLRRNYAGFVSGRPIGSFLLLGPTGVGKTEFAKALAAVLFRDETAMLRLDMTEFMEAHSVSRLIGAPPGYVGHDAGGQLTDAVRRTPYQLVLLDELEKAHPDVLNILIQVLDEGHLTDSHGRKVDFGNTVIVMTSNLGASEALSASSPRRRVGFSTSDDAPAGSTNVEHSRVLDEARRHLRPELWNRIDETLVFGPLNRDEVARIARLQLTRSSERLVAERGIAFACSPEVIDFLIESGGYDVEMGARPMRRTIERLVEARIAELILAGEVEAPALLEVSVVDQQVVIRPSGST